MFFEADLLVMCEYDMVVQTKPMKIIECFDEIMQKIWFKIGVGKLMKIFFIRNVPNNIPWSLKIFPVMSVMIFPRKTIKKIHVFPCLAITVGSPIVNAPHYSIALQKRVFLMRERRQK